MKDLLNKIKNYIYENRQFITASILSAIALIVIIIAITTIELAFAHVGILNSFYISNNPIDLKNLYVPS